MKILITGAKGQLGTEICEILANNGCLAGKLPEQFVDAQVVSLGSSELDISDFENTKKVIENHDPDLIINCAAYTAVDKAESESERCIFLNESAAANIAQICEEKNIKYVYPSSESVFGGKGDTPFTEDDDMKPTNVYGKSKMLGELAVLKANPSALIVRAGWLYGFYGKNFVKTMANLFKIKDKITVVADQFGNPTNVDEFVYKMFLLLDKKKCGIYQCPDAEVTTRFEFADYIAKALNSNCVVLPCTTEEYPLPAPRSKYMGLSCEKVNNALNIKSKNWKTVVEAFICEAQKRGII